MRQTYNWPWVKEQAARAARAWNESPARSALAGPVYSVEEQRHRERAYDDALRAAEREAKRAPRTRAQRLEAQERMTAAFARFSAIALGLEGEATQLLTEEFLPAGTKFSQWARRFDASLSMADIVQACRNAWTACGLQPLLGEEIRITPSIAGYSLLYPYSDNYLDCEDVSAQAKLRFSERFRDRLLGEGLRALNAREAAVWSLVGLIEEQYPRARYPQVFECLLAIHRAQEESIAQQRSGGECGEAEILGISCAKGGSSVLADACLAHGWLEDEESEFGFDWGVLLQLGDDLQDVREDLRRGSVTLFSRAAMSGRPLDGPATQLLNLSDRVSSRMDRLPNGSSSLKGLLRMSWRSLIVMAVADSREFFTPEFLAEAERGSPFRFEFLRARRDRLTGRRGLYETLFEAFLEPRGDGDDSPPLPRKRMEGFEPIGAAPIADLTAL
jgi:hypothetical protein